MSGVGRAADLQRIAALILPGRGRRAGSAAAGVPQRAVVLVILGVLLGPGYQYYIMHLSGRDTARVELRERAERWVLPDGSIERFRSGFAYRPTILELDPARNQVRLRLTFRMASGESAPPAAPANEYEATLLEFDHPLQRRTFKLDAAPGSSHTVDLPAMEVRASGAHLFVLQELGVPARQVSVVTLQVVEEVERMVQPVAWAGTAMLLAGLTWLAWALYRPSPA